MFPPPKKQHDEDLIDMTAMVDIVFFLLIFFLVTSMQAVAAVLNLPNPEQSASKSTPQTAMQIRSDPNALIVKIEADDSISIDDEVVFGDSALNLALKNARDDRSGDPPVLVIGSPDASHGAAVRVLDACASAKLTSVRFLVESDDADSD